MAKVCFVVGHEDTPEAPSDTPEAYWRVYLPGQRFGTAAILGRHGATQKALQADVVWVHQPTCFAAASLVEVARQMEKPVVVDFLEDPWRRIEADRSYSDARLDAMERALAAATVIAVASDGLVPIFEPYAPTMVVEPVVPLAGWVPAPPEQPPLIAWWSDGRQKSGFELVADGLREVLVKTEARMAHIQFSHHTPLMRGVKDDEDRMARARRLSAFFEDDRELSAEQNLNLFVKAFSGATISLECYAPGEYRDTVSDLPLLRAAALGIPSITTRGYAPPGTISAQPLRWADTILDVLGDSLQRRRLSEEARAWAETRSSYKQYEAIIEEVLT